MLICLLFGLWIVSFWKSKQYLSLVNALELFKTVRGRLFIFFVASILGGILISAHVQNGLWHLLKLIELTFFGWYVSTHIKNKRDIITLCILLGIGIFFESLLAIVQFIHQGSVGGLFYLLGERFFTPSTPGIANASINGELILRPYGTFSHPNVLAAYLLVGMLLVIFLFRRTLPLTLDTPFINAYPCFKKIPQGNFFIFNSPRLFWTLVLLFGTVALVFSMSRIILAVWFFFLVILLIRHVRPLLQQLAKFWIAVLVVVISLLTVGFLQSPFGERLLQSNLGEESVVQRVMLSQASVKLFLQHPFFGVGLGNFLAILPTVQQPLVSVTYLQPVHNIFLLVLTETGLIGFGYFIYFLVLTYKRLLAMIDTNESMRLIYRVCLLVITVMLILGAVDHYFFTLQQGQLLFTLLIGLSWADFKENV